MRRSTAAVVGTLTGAALITGVRLSASAPVGAAAPPAVDLAGSGATSPHPSPAKSGSKKNEPTKEPTKGSTKESTKEPTQQPTQNPTQGTTSDGAGEAGGTGLTDGTFKGKGATNPYGTIQVTIKIDRGRIVAADATYPITGRSGTINPDAIPKLNQETLTAQSADIDAVSGATYTSNSYVDSLQSALDAAGA